MDDTGLAKNCERLSSVTVWKAAPLAVVAAAAPVAPGHH